MIFALSHSYMLLPVKQQRNARAAQTENASRAVLTWIVADGNGKMVCVVFAGRKNFTACGKYG